MKTDVMGMQYWSTASFGDSADTSPADLAPLGAHLRLCKKQYGRLFSVQCLVQSTHGFVNAHFVTTMVLLTLLVSVSLVVF